MATFMLYLITLNAGDGTEIRRVPIQGRTYDQQTCLKVEAFDRKLERVRQENGKPVIDRRQCVRMP